MITILNRREVFVGNSLDRFNKIRDCLNANGIEYSFRVVEHNKGRKGRIGSFGIDVNLLKTYYIYVYKRDYKYACVVINECHK